MVNSSPKHIFISNRLPFSVDENKELKRGSGGLVSALLGVSLDEPFTWMGFETSEFQADLFKKDASSVQKNLLIEPVLIDKKLYDCYYDEFCNDVLWPLFHYESQQTFFKQEAWDAYVLANKLMANAILKTAKDNDNIWIHDFHFFLLPKMLKDINPRLKIGVFLHTPFPSAEIFRQLPVREELLGSVILADLIGFHEHSYLRHFTVSMKAHLGIDSSFFKARIGNHILHLGVYPISIDSIGLKAKAESPKVVAQTKEYYNTINSEYLILGVDRLDYSKGLKLKLKGFKRLLRKYPELIGRVNLLQVAIPTRIKVPSYIHLKNEIDKLVGEINGEFGRPDYNPVSYIYNSVSEVELLALYRRSQAMLITSKRDGMNLVSMEYCISQNMENPGSLILSEFAGAASLFGSALIINPWNEDSIADNIYQSFIMEKEEKIQRMEGIQNILTKYSASMWARNFLKDLEGTHEGVVKGQTIKILPELEKWPLEMKQILQKYKKIKLFLDYDGTLVGFHNKYQEASISPEMISLLKDLSKWMKISIISGRSPEFLDSQFNHVDVEMAAEHGAYYKDSKSEWICRVTSDTSTWFPEVIKVMNSYTDKVPLSSIEIKKSSVVWHYRQSPNDFATFQARKLDDELQACLSNQPVAISIGSKIVEAKATECNKGDYIRFRMSQEDDTLFICIGDDKTDEDMFKIAKENGLTIKVGSEESEAQFCLAKQSDVFTFLKGLYNYENGPQI
ncbi:bifunctional alpha,alpha-trehalose-phosphate synthase (UDP-forming)/trehalose-phosphatase [Bacteriovorax sp. PP10]|uniref:Bifunctional alpha,alpha-trehalose-phosphate synthase (UDP-forming)/trehalose-phosphatase n=1 Tax=Bacteriovorax antarcticus TaxID=3088717 RepID=A0ABU5VTA5_9BACT|nr:bifunctional alpha,alpha-trehalose-phosphate synthase (UDP-forming)/trehalose-phosphatase [Bacteriovorax sp. PP10]MEA9356286.1 bifunctional alpha,alpha-trehalose-phosphate synthase (UDP-forming)/trehalose-phosphatase [Bacteriovorax sp. PP10]